MKFTVCFSGDEALNLAYALVFVPGPCWVESGAPGGEPWLVNMSSVPMYRPGGVTALFEAVPGLENRVSRSSPVFVVAHPEGYGTAADLAALQADLEDAGFEVVTTP